MQPRHHLIGINKVNQIIPFRSHLLDFINYFFDIG